MNIYQQAVQGARFFDLDTRQGSEGQLHAVHAIADGDELSVVSVMLRLGLFTYVLLRLRVQNRRKKWNFPLNFQTVVYPGLLLKGPSFRVTE